MPAGYEGNRHARLGGFRHRSQFLLQRISPPALHASEYFNSINGIWHRRITRRKPSPYSMQLCPVKMGTAPP
jgi:hypothetical protein